MAQYTSRYQCPKCAHRLYWVLSLVPLLEGEVLELSCPMCAKCVFGWTVTQRRGELLYRRFYPPVPEPRHRVTQYPRSAHPSRPVRVLRGVGGAL